MDQNILQEPEKVQAELNQPPESNQKKRMPWWGIALIAVGGLIIISIIAVVILISVLSLKNTRNDVLDTSMATITVKKVPAEYSEAEASTGNDTINYFTDIESPDGEIAFYHCIYADSAAKYLEEDMKYMQDDEEVCFIIEDTYTNNEGREFQYVCISVSWEDEYGSWTSDCLEFATELGDGELLTVGYFNMNGNQYVPEDYFQYLDSAALEIEQK